MKKNIIDFKALFLGSKSENEQEFGNYIKLAYNDVSSWRRDYHAEDDVIITSEDKQKESYKYTAERTDDVLKKVSSLLRSGSIPWHSPRYLGHMNSETLMPGIIAYFETMFFNGNNVAYESSPATSKMESEVGMDLAVMLGYDKQKAWGHLSADGSVANYEGLWYARNFKSLPFAISKVCPDEFKGKSEWELFNVSVDETLDILDRHMDKIAEIKDATVRNDSTGINKLGKWFVPRTKHYSWLKGADIIGIGTNNITPVDIDEYFRMDIVKLEKQLRECVANKTPILGVVAVVGTTEEGAVDHVDKVVELREKLHKELGVWFYFHVDAAYGGYGRSIFLDEDNKFIPFENLQSVYKEYGVFTKDIDWPSRDVYNAYKAIGKSESVTIDPHKMGYAPYAAGGITIRDRRMKNAISYFATYVFDTKVKIPDLLGAYIFEGSKAGATAAAVWANHQIAPLNVSGYGRLIGHGIEGAHNYADHIVKTKKYVVNGKNVLIHLLVKPDFNIVDFVLNVEGNTSLATMNELNLGIYEESSFVEGDTFHNDVLLSHSDFSKDDYSSSPKELIDRAGVSYTEFLNGQPLTILRSCILSPWLHEAKTAKTFFDIFDVAITKKLARLVK